MNQNNYFSKLDVYRFIAVFLVLVEHFAHSLGRHISAGYYGVDMFFVLSGFLISGILLKPEPKSPLKAWINFLGRRSLRIFPIYYLTIIILLILGYPPLMDNLPALLSYTYNYAWVLFDLPLSNISHFWSLAVEEQFYLLWPLIIIFLLRRNSKNALVISLTIYLICSIQLVFEIIPSITKFNGVGLFPQANSLALGAIGAVMYKTGKIQNSRYLKNKSIEVGILILLVFFLLTDYKIKYFLLPLISLYIILKCVTCTFQFEQINKFFDSKRLMYLGTISYGIYIYHLPLEHYLTTYLFDPFLWQQINFQKLGSFAKIEFHSYILKFPIYSILSIVLAHFSFQYFEKPILKLKDKWFSN